MPDAADRSAPPSDGYTLLTGAPERSEDSAPERGGVGRVHAAAFGLLLVAILFAVALPALAAPKARRGADPQALAATVATPTPPPTPEALAMLDAAIADGRLADARSLIAPMWASGTPDVLLRGAELA
ncbi:MAG: hypothetical protein RIS17_1939, partial [Pseudomonadota bacterium]